MAWYEDPRYLTYCEQPSCDRPGAVAGQCRTPEYEEGCFRLRTMVGMTNVRNKVNTLETKMVDVKNKVDTLETTMKKPRPSSSSSSTLQKLPAFNPTKGFHNVTSSYSLQDLTNQEIRALEEDTREYCETQTHDCAKAYVENDITSKNLFDMKCSEVGGSLEKGETYSFCNKPVATIPNKGVGNRCQMWDVTETSYMNRCLRRP